MFGMPDGRRSSTVSDNGPHRAAGARLRLPARRQRRHGLPLPQRHACSTTTGRTRQERQQLEAVHARLRQQPGADRRPAGHADPANSGVVVGQTRGSTCSTRAPRQSECDVIVKGAVGGEQRGWYRLPGGSYPQRPRREPPIDRRHAARSSRNAPARSSPTPACRPAPASAWASTATRTATSTATSSTPAAIRPIRSRSRPAPPRRWCRPRRW